MNALIKTNVASNVLWEPEILYGDKILKKKKKTSLWYNYA